MPSLRVHASVIGVVQGVGFRYYVLRIARGLEITGYVRNARDGSLEVVAEGPKSELDTLIGHLREGPLSSAVSDVKVEWEEPTHEFAQFEIAL